jgi:hypothetical protein
MKQDINEISINGIDYVRKDSVVNNRAQSVDGMPYVIVRSQSAGVFAGYLKERNGLEVTLINARRMWYWIGATLSEIAQSGTPEPQNCKFPEEVDEILIMQAIEVLQTTQACFESIKKVKIWKR